MDGGFTDRQYSTVTACIRSFTHLPTSVKINMTSPQTQAAPGFDMATGLSEELKARYQQVSRPPEFDSPAHARLHGKQRLAAAFRLFSKFGFDEGADVAPV